MSNLNFTFLNNKYAPKSHMHYK